jgi:hypothetical protein
MRKSTKLATAAGAAAVVLVAGTAFTASNTLPNAVAGTGSNTVSGVTVTAYDYGFVGGDSANDISSVAFTLASPLSETQAFDITSSVNANAASSCAVTNTTTITCTYPTEETGVTLAELTSTSLTVLPNGPELG